MNEASQFIGGIASCYFSRPVAVSRTVSSGVKTFNLSSGSYHLLFATAGFEKGLSLCRVLIQGCNKPGFREASFCSLIHNTPGCMSYMQVIFTYSQYICMQGKDYTNNFKWLS